MDSRNSFAAGAIAAAVAWVSGIAMTVLTRGVDLQVTQTVETKEKLLSIIQTQPDLLLKFMGLDTIFVIGYVVVFCALFLAVPPTDRLMAGVGLAAGLLAGAADTLENVLYITYGVGQLHGSAVAPELPFHYYVSGLKWMSAFISVAITLLVFPRRTRLEKLLVLVMLSFPVGGALSIAYPDLLPLRALFFVIGMPLFAIYFTGRSREGGKTHVA